MFMKARLNLRAAEAVMFMNARLKLRAAEAVMFMNARFKFGGRHAVAKPQRDLSTAFSARVFRPGRRCARVVVRP